MANFVETTDFKGDYHIGGLGHSGSGAKTLLQDIMNEQEPLILRGVLGDWLYTGLLNDLVNGIPQTQKYVDLVNGYTYTNTAGYTVIYEGFKPFLVRMIFEHYTQTNQYKSTVIGSVQSNSENDTTLSRAELYKVKNRVWNSGIRYYYDCVRLLDDKQSTYFENNEYSNWLDTFKKVKAKGKIIAKSTASKYFLNKTGWQA